MKGLPYTKLEISSWEDVPQALSSMVRDIEGRVIPAQNKARAWDHIRVEIWPDSGRYIAFPAHFQSEFRIDITGCQVICKEIEQSLSNLISSEVGDAEYEIEVKKIISRMAKLAKPELENLDCESYVIVDPDGEEVKFE